MPYGIKSEREREVLYISNSTDKRERHKVTFSKVWNVGEHQRKMKIVCRQPGQDTFLYVAYIIMRKFKAIGMKTSLPFLLFWRYSNRQMNTCEMNVRLKINYMNSTIFVGSCEIDNL